MLKEKVNMKNKTHNEIVMSPEIMEILFLVTEEEYDEALEMVEEYISQTECDEIKNIAVMMSLQILALAGYIEIASVLLKQLCKRFRLHDKARDICKRTIKTL